MEPALADLFCVRDLPHLLVLVGAENGKAYELVLAVSPKRQYS